MEDVLLSWEMCVAAFLWYRKMHRSVTTKILSQDMFVRCDTRKPWKLPNVDGYRFLYHKTQKKRDRAPRWRWIVDDVFQVDSRASKDANGHVSQCVITQSCVFCFLNTVVFSSHIPAALQTGLSGDKKNPRASAVEKPGSHQARTPTTPPSGLVQQPPIPSPPATESCSLASSARDREEWNQQRHSWGAGDIAKETGCNVRITRTFTP